MDTESCPKTLNCKYFDRECVDHLFSTIWNTHVLLAWYTRLHKLLNAQLTPREMDYLLRSLLKQSFKLSFKKICVV